MAVVIVGTLDTKGLEIAFFRDLLRAEGLQTLVIDAGSLGDPRFTPDLTREQVFERAGTSFETILARGDRGEAVAAAARGVAALVSELEAGGRIDGIFGLGGSAGTVIGSAAMRALPFGLPKVMVSTLASGQTRPFVGGSDILMLYPVADIAGLNRLTRVTLTNAAMALAGMVLRRPNIQKADESRPLVVASMFGVTTPCVDNARRALDRSGLEVVVFHATGVGGQSMEGLIRDGEVAGVLDLTTTELADELVGGILTAGPERLKAAVKAKLPQVVSLGALDMVNFGPRETIPDRYRGRRFHAHNPSVTLMRTTVEENAQLGSWIAKTLGASTAPTVVLIPRRGVSALDQVGGPFHDPEADAALFGAIKAGLEGHPTVKVVERDEHINDPAFGASAAETLLRLMGLPLNP